jgi:hypothetical protein
MTRSIVMAVALGFVILSSASARVAPQAQDATATLRTFLVKYGFDGAIAAADAPDVDRALAGWGVSISDDTMVLAYYYKDPAKPNQLGQLHVSRVDRTGAPWLHTEISERDGGSVISISIGDRYIVVELHINPSMNEGVILDAKSLQRVSAVQGYGFQPLADGSVLFSGGMVHFAPVHKETLRLFANGQAVELFPGPQPSPLASAYRASFVKAAEALSPAQRQVFAERNAPPDEFDISVSSLKLRDDHKRLAFVATYDSNTLRDLPHPTMQTVVRCDRKATLSWTCRGRELTEHGRSVRVALEKGPEGRYAEAALAALVDAVLRER